MEEFVFLNRKIYFNTIAQQQQIHVFFPRVEGIDTVTHSLESSVSFGCIPTREAAI